MKFEIERKWMPEKAPAVIKGKESREIIQGYLCTDPVIRIRREGERYYLTYKGTGAVKRVEYNMDLNEKAFCDLLPKCEGRIIEKTRYFVPLENGLRAEVDIFHGDLEGRVYVEVEFDSEEEAESYRAPEWFGMEVTGMKCFSNAALSSTS